MAKKKSQGLVFKKLLLSWHKAFLQLSRLGGFSSHNQVKIFHDGDEAFLAIFDALKKARYSIYMETYILAADSIGFTIRDLLLEAKKRGITVTVIYDHWGSSALPYAFLKPLIDAGVKILPFNPIWPWRRRGPLLFRDHRKIIVIDEQQAFCGSMNLSADYAGIQLGTNRFRDTVAQVRGPAVKDLLAITLESIAESEFVSESKSFKEALAIAADSGWTLKLFFDRLRKNHTLKPKSPPDSPPNEGTLVQVLRSNMRRDLAHIQKSMEEATNRAVHYCYFTTPYFLPHDGLRKALINAKRRGVDVRILTAGLSDVPLMRYASRHVYESFLKSGIRIYEMTKKTLHAKIATIDGLYATVGSYNLDHWSARRNLEVNIALIDPGIAFELKEQFNKDLELALEIKQHEIANRSLFARFLCWAAFLILRI